MRDGAAQLPRNAATRERRISEDRRRQNVLEGQYNRPHYVNAANAEFAGRGSAAALRYDTIAETFYHFAKFRKDNFKLVLWFRIYKTFCNCTRSKQSSSVKYVFISWCSVQRAKGRRRGWRSCRRGSRRSAPAATSSSPAGPRCPTWSWCGTSSGRTRAARRCSRTPGRPQYRSCLHALSIVQRLLSQMSYTIYQTLVMLQGVH